MNSHVSDFDIFPVVLILAGVLLVAVVLIIDRARKKSAKIQKSKTPSTKAEETEPSPAGNRSAAIPPPIGTTPAASRSSGPALKTLDRRSSAIFDFLRVLLIPLSLIVAAGFLLILLPQSTTDRWVQDLQLRSDASGEEQIALLYLGHQLGDGEFKVRCVVRNITAEPMEQLDAAVRLYSSSGDLLETAIVRMDKENLNPDEIGRFELVYPGYRSEFSSYSVDFKLRRGEFVRYKDMRRQPEGELQ